MKKRMYLCLMLTALYLSLSAQPHIEIKGKDTSAVIPIQQLRIANGWNVELKGCKQENDSLYSEMRTYTGLVNNLRSSITDLKQANALNQFIINDKQKIIDLSDKELKKSNRKAKFYQAGTYSMAGACLILIGKILIFK